jgi:hypothetical protein
MTSAEHEEQLQTLHAQIDQLVERALRHQQELARYQRRLELLRQLPAEVCQTLGPELLEQLLRREAETAADRAAREFPQVLSAVERRAEHRYRRL